jgi:CRISPR-associated protein Cas2
LKTRYTNPSRAGGSVFVLMIYDVGEKRVNKVLKVGRKYLNWVQNSVLEGELSPAVFEKLKLEVQKKIKEDYDSVIFYLWRTERYTSREIMGKEKSAIDIII